MKGTYGVLEARMSGSRIYNRGNAQLVNSGKALHQWVLNDIQ
jgi:hypothetical protein